jgi:nitroimidazol reductase NimA-like FMN-containing flavoprotein (pyridoxamine 5'-phosphate oxidase superfamily)
LEIIEIIENNIGGNMEIKQMRRKDKEITDINEKIKIIDKCKVCRLAMACDNQPYIVPLNFGYAYENDLLTLYFHGAHEGMKIDILRKNDEVCFEIDCNHALIEADDPAKYSFAFESIIGFGKIIFLETDEEKSYGLNQLMKHQTGKDIKYQYPADQLKSVNVYKMQVRSFTGKRKPFPTKE